MAVLRAQHALQAGVAWYGRLVGDKSDLLPASPLDLAAKLHAPVLGLYGAEDTGIPLETVERMREAIAAAKGASRIDVFDGAPHGFHADYRPSYNAPTPRTKAGRACSPGSRRTARAFRA